MRRTITLTLVSALTGLAALAALAPSVSAQDASARRVRPRIVVTPAQRPYRQCVDVYVIEHRLTGDTVVPDMRCRWAYR